MSLKKDKRKVAKMTNKSVNTIEDSLMSDILTNTYSVYKDWNRWDQHLVGYNNYKQPKNQFNINGRFIYNNLNDMTTKEYIYPYHEYNSYDPYLYTQISSWPSYPKMVWGNGVFNKYGYYLPKKTKQVSN
jgi:hypothetical protein